MIKADKMQITKEDVKRIKKIAQKTADIYDAIIGDGFDFSGYAWIYFKDAKAKKMLEKAGLIVDKHPYNYYALSISQLYDFRRNVNTYQSYRLQEAVCRNVEKELKNLGIDCFSYVIYD